MHLKHSHASVDCTERGGNNEVKINASESKQIDHYCKNGYVHNAWAIIHTSDANVSSKELPCKDVVSFHRSRVSHHSIADHREANLLVLMGVRWHMYHRWASCDEISVHLHQEVKR